MTKDSSWHNIPLEDLVSETRNPFKQFRADLDYEFGSNGTWALPTDVTANNVSIGDNMTVSTYAINANNVTVVNNSNFSAGSVVADNFTVGQNTNASVESFNGGTLTVGAGSILTIAPIPGGPLAGSYMNSVNPIPEPSTMALLCMAGVIGVGFGAYSWKRRVVF